MSPAEKSALETYRRCADRCVDLSAENKRLREVLEKFVKGCDKCLGSGWVPIYGTGSRKCEVCAIARAALAAPEAKEPK